MVLEREPLRSVYLLYGEETFLVERALGVLAGRFGDDGTRRGWRTVWADDGVDVIKAALDDLTTPSLFGGASVLVVRHVEGFAEGGQELLLGRLADVSGTSRLLMLGGPVDARRKLVTTCQRNGCAYAFAPITDLAVAKRWVVQLARERGHAIAATAVEELLDRVGTGLGLLDGEIEKLSLALGPGTEIDREAVRTLVGAVRTLGVEELTDRLARRDLGGAIRTFRTLLDDGEPPIRVLAFLAANLRRALHVAELAEEGLRPEEIGRRIGMPPWLVQKNSGRGTSTHLRAVLRELRRVDLDLKRSRPAAAVFERALLGLPAAPSR